MAESWIQVLTIIISNFALMSGVFGLFLWARSEARHDQQELRQIARSIQDEMKDFHGRLCAIEERRIKNSND